MKDKILSTVITTVIAASVMVPVSAKDTGYQTLSPYDNTKVTAGSYTLKMDKKGNINIKKDSGKFKKTALKTGGTAAAGSSDLYYFKDNVLMRYILKSGKSEKVKTFNDTPKNNENDDKIGYYVSACSGDAIYISSDNFADWEYNTFLYKPENGKTKKLFKGKIDMVNGKYIIADMHYRSDVSPTTYNLYKITANGTKKIKTLSKASYGIHIEDGKYFYSTLKDDGRGDTITYGSKIISCDANGKNAKTLKELDGSAEFLHFSNDKIYFVEHSEDSNKEYCGKLCELGKDGTGYRVISDKVDAFDIEKVTGNFIYYGDGTANYSVNITTGEISKVK